MTKAEIRKKFDEIVDFAGVERYMDTPVKRYSSSGMYVRLAFAVAAHLEPEILIADFYNSRKLYPPGWQGKGVLLEHHWECPKA
jgi:ABC-type polysaccharide/polyol phosphate transport system ATPase subunit